MRTTLSFLALDLLCVGERDRGNLQEGLYLLKYAIGELRERDLIAGGNVSNVSQHSYV